MNQIMADFKINDVWKPSLPLGNTGWHIFEFRSSIAYIIFRWKLISFAFVRQLNNAIEILNDDIRNVQMDAWLKDSTRLHQLPSN